MLFTHKYKPASLSQIVGNSEEIKKINTWALDWQRGKTNKPLIIFGPTGVGKTSIAYALENQFDWEILELNSSDIRNKLNTEKTIGFATENKTLSGKIRLILIDDVDKMSATDRGGVSAIATFIKTSKQPIILTADDIWDKKLTPLRNLCNKVNLKKINSLSMKKYLRVIAQKEEIEISEEELNGIISFSSGDLRAALNDLQAKNLHASRDKQIKIFDALKIIFKTKNYSEVRKSSFNIDIDHNMFKMWIDENIPREYEKTNDIAKAYDYLSRADIFDGRIYKRQYWGFLRYSTDLMTAGVSLAKEEKYIKFVNYAFPSYIQKMGSSKSKRNSEKEMARKFKKRLHGSTSKIIDSLDILKDLIKKDINRGMSFYDLDISEVSYILGVSEAQIKRLIKKKEEVPKSKIITKPEKIKEGPLNAFF